MFLYFMVSPRGARATLMRQAFVDRGNLVRRPSPRCLTPQGNAKLQGLQQDVLESSSKYYQIASVMLYVGLVAFQIPVRDPDGSD